MVSKHLSTGNSEACENREDMAEDVRLANDERPRYNKNHSCD
jgi:hypothetical protein